jgi:hypothetical protein
VTFALKERCFVWDVFWHPQSARRAPMIISLPAFLYILSGKRQLHASPGLIRSVPIWTTFGLLRKQDLRAS